MVKTVQKAGKIRGNGKVTYRIKPCIPPDLALRPCAGVPQGPEVELLHPSPGVIQERQLVQDPRLEYGNVARGRDTSPFVRQKICPQSRARCTARRRARLLRDPRRSSHARQSTRGGAPEPPIAQTDRQCPRQPRQQACRGKRCRTPDVLIADARSALNPGSTRMSKSRSWSCSHSVSHGSLVVQTRRTSICRRIPRTEKSSSCKRSLQRSYTLRAVPGARMVSNTERPAQLHVGPVIQRIEDRIRHGLGPTSRISPSRLRRPCNSAPGRR